MWFMSVREWARDAMRDSSIDIVNDWLLFEFLLTPQYKWPRNAGSRVDHIIFRKTSATPQRAPEFNSVQCIGINGVLTFLFGHPVSIQLCDTISAICSLQGSVLIIDYFLTKDLIFRSSNGLWELSLISDA